MGAVAVEVPVWRFYPVEVARVRRVGPSFVRVTLTGADLDELADNGLDQRVKLLLPGADGGFAHLGPGAAPSWYAAWRLLPEASRPPIRTYTVRGVRPAAREVDLDMVLHGDTGPGSAFAGSATPGDRAMLLGPNLRHPGRHGGLEFRPPEGHLGPTLLAGDETAVPALLSILAALPPAAYGEAVLEVPDPGDVAALTDLLAADATRPGPVVPVGVRVTWLVRGRHGSTLDAEVRAAADRLGLRPAAGAGGTVRAGGAEELPGTDAEGGDPGSDPGSDPGGDPLWDVPDQAAPTGLYAWLAGESSVVTGLRRHLVRGLGVDRGGVAFMGYWKRGRAEC